MRKNLTKEKIKEGKETYGVFVSMWCPTIVEIIGHTGFDFPGIAHNKRHTERFLIHESLVEPTVIAQEEALVGSVDHHRIF